MCNFNRIFFSVSYVTLNTFSEYYSEYQYDDQILIMSYRKEIELSGIKTVIKQIYIKKRKNVFYFIKLIKLY